MLYYFIPLRAHAHAHRMRTHRGHGHKPAPGGSLGLYRPWGAPQAGSGRLRPAPAFQRIEDIDQVALN